MEGGQDMASFADPNMGAPKPKFSKDVLKMVVGEDRANKVLTSLSMSIIPNVGGGSIGKDLCNNFKSSKSQNDFGNMIKLQLKRLEKKVSKKPPSDQDSSNINQFLVDDDDDGDDFSDDVDFNDGENKGLAGETDPSKLIDLELVNLLKFCNNLKNKHKESEEYQDAVMMQSTELGGLKKQKTLILDMDETMIAAKFNDNLPKNFVPSFTFNFQGSDIHVRFRPYLQDTLDKLKELYELVAWTAGVKDYADPILDKIDPDGTIFKTRLFRDSCIKCDQFFIKDLDILLDREKSKMLIVDNSILSFAFDLPNGVPINSFMGDEADDRDLLYLYSFLEEAFYYPDITVACEESFKLGYLLSTITGKAQEEVKE